MIPLYHGFDPREEVGCHTFVSSVIHRASCPVSFIPLHMPHFQPFYSAGNRDGTNAFTYTRFLIPFLQDFKGWAIFADGADMVCLADIRQLWALRDHYMAVQVVQHDYLTSHPRKYLGTGMEAENHDYPRKNWSSLMLINCSHFAWRQMTPEWVERMSGEELHQFRFIPENRVGALPVEWNWLVDEYGANPEAKMLHFTTGIPIFAAYRNTPGSSDWFAAAEKVASATG